MMSEEKPSVVAFTVGADASAKTVIFQFSAPVSRIEFSPEQAREIARNIVSRAFIADGTIVGEQGQATPMSATACSVCGETRYKEVVSCRRPDCPSTEKL